ncbi:glycosyltransferase family 2 protein [Belliella kenyensis]|uniref:Glycosyltransferase family 2 protein n=1 Tax=Belliella kenyensis TaxID=1472724 RepID=A0ABV8EQQ9_9BACT|nr:glycosyltransferase family 2 protein [Belliella kenyensis]MCH7401637.1 glycosyltransferase family 2 protein [Belliella kenyensis]MDN3603085.1 glycosyltransferase family 2 protein [Belliella kenyensis]
MNQSKVAAVVVTYNRKDQLLTSLDALLAQERTLDAIILVDNCSKDGTREMLQDMGIIDETISLESKEKVVSQKQVMAKKPSKDVIAVTFIGLSVNSGGAGGFYEGVKFGYEAGFDWLWLMDDDGSADPRALGQLLRYTSKANFLNSLVLDIKDPSKLSFELNYPDGHGVFSNKKEVIDNSVDGIILGQANPFNGTLVSKILIEQIGYPKKEMFIWGDEVDYQYRAAKSGLGIATVVSAIHYHPKAATKILNLPFRGLFIAWSGIPIKDYCNVRNTAYIHKKHFPKSVLTTFMKYLIYFVPRLDFSSLKLCYQATMDGLNERWGREKNYMK